MLDLQVLNERYSKEEDSDVQGSEMEYASKESSSPIASPNNGFWVRENKIHDVTSGSHVMFLIEHPELFEITTDTIRNSYRKHHETIGAEGKARDKLVRLAALKGWIRIRHYSKPKDYWSIQSDSTDKRRDDIKEFIGWAIVNKIMGENDMAVILGFDDPKYKHEYGWKSGGIKAYMDEQ